MKRLIILLILAFVASATTISWRKSLLPFIEMAHKSELIVHGFIIESNNKNYVFQAIKYLKGSEKKPIIQIEKYSPWMCDHKRYIYEKNAVFMLFLQKNEHGNWTPIQGSTGEKLVQADSIGFGFHEIFDLESVAETVTVVLSCFEESEKKHYVPICSGSILDSLCLNNSFFTKAYKEQLGANEYWGIRRFYMEKN
jgi:hypothetical protein